MSIPSTWKTVLIGESLDLINGRAFKANEWARSGKPIIRIQNLNNRDASFNYYQGELPEKFGVSKGDLLFAWSGTPGTSFGAHVWKGPDAWLNQHIFKVIFPTSVFDRSFLSFAINQNLLQYIKVAHGGAGLAHITKGKFEASLIPLPPVNEQKRIVAKIEELFSELDAGEESLRQARRQLGVYRQSLLKQAFEGKLTAQWREQNPDKFEPPAQLLDRIELERQIRHEQQLKEWEESIRGWDTVDADEKRPPKPQKVNPSNESIAVFDGTHPDSWVTLNLSQFILELGQGWSPKCENYNVQGDEWAVIKTTAIQFGHFDASENKALPKHLAPRRWLALRTGEILITRAGPRSRCGVVCRVRENHPYLMLCDKAYKLVLSESATYPEFLERLLCSPAATAAIEKLKTGINDSGVNITQTAFLQLALPIPPLPEQEEIVRILEEQFEAIAQNEQEIDAALKRSEALRQSILKQAFSGQLVAQDPTDEPASALLARIRAERETPQSRSLPPNGAPRRSRGRKAAPQNAGELLETEVS